MEYWSMNEGIDELIRLYANGSLIPFFGSGFSHGSTTCGGCVPDSESAMELMRERILKHSDKFKESYLSTCDFNEISSYFFQLVPRKEQVEFFKDYFTGAVLSDVLRDFIALRWPYAYTINIDDAIEATSLFIPVLPYINLDRPSASVHLLYKLHGDANREISPYRRTNDNIIFSQEQYLKSIIDESNLDILNNLRADYTQKNMLFIGCGLQSEKDLEYVASSIDSKPNNIYRILVRQKKPDCREEFHLENKMKINRILIADNYSSFYAEMIKRAEKAQIDLMDYKFTNPKIVAAATKDENISYLSGENIFLPAKNSFIRYSLQIARSCVDEIEGAFSEYDCVLLQGRRFSGKTSVLSYICEQMRKFTVYFFPSTSLVDEELVADYLNKKEKSLFVFDSHSVSSAAYKVLSKSADTLREKKNKIIIAINSRDNFMLNSLKATLIELPIWFNNDELSDFNRHTDQFGFIKRKHSDSNLDYINLLSEKQRIPIRLVDDIKYKSSHISNIKEYVLILLLCALDKIFMDEIQALKISFSELQHVKDVFPLLIDEVEVTREESQKHSSTKVIHNSKWMMLALLQEISNENIIESILHIVKCLRTDRTRNRIYQDVILFDTLNQIFGGKSGAGNLIFKVYESLEGMLNSDVHYWLQRAKSIYRLTPKNIGLLEKAYEYAQKTYCDSRNKNTQAKAALSKALISCLLSQIDSEKTDIHIREAICMAHEAIFSKYYQNNISYLSSELSDKRKLKKGYHALLETICTEYLKRDSGDFQRQAQEILNKLQMMQVGMEGV